MDGGAWEAIVHVVTKSRTWLSDFDPWIWASTEHIRIHSTSGFRHGSDFLWQVYVKQFNRPVLSLHRYLYPGSGPSHVSSLHPLSASHKSQLVAWYLETLSLGPISESPGLSFSWEGQDRLLWSRPFWPSACFGQVWLSWVLFRDHSRASFSLPLAASPPLCHHLWERDDHFPTDVRQHQQVPWDAQQCPGLPEALPGAQGAEWASHGLHRVHLVHVQRHWHGEGKEVMGSGKPLTPQPSQGFLSFTSDSSDTWLCIWTHLDVVLESQVPLPETLIACPSTFLKDRWLREIINW